MKRIGRLALDLLYPRRCPVCHEAAPAGLSICPDCLGKLPYVTGPVCRKCGKTVERDQVFCEDCLGTRHAYEEGLAAFRYEGVMRESLAYLKNKGRAEYGETLGRLLAEYGRERILAWQPEVIVPVPVHRDKLRERGYNQAQIIAEAVGTVCGIPLKAGGLTRTRETRAMKGLGAADRRRNLASVMEAGPGMAGVRRVLLVDDIYTTGATADACAGALKVAGVEEVYLASVSIGTNLHI